MALIKIDELRTASSEFSADAEGFMSELAEEELVIKGGGSFFPGTGTGLVGAGVGQLNILSVTNNGDVNVNSGNHYGGDW